MEDTLRVEGKAGTGKTAAVVLILVLMEDTLRELAITPQRLQVCLNPCFNGRYSQSAIIS